MAFLAANLPFINQSLFACIPLSKHQHYKKPILIRLCEFLALYVMMGVGLHILEAYYSSVYSQNWQFYVVTGCLFAVFAYPGYVYCYLRRSVKGRNDG